MSFKDRARAWDNDARTKRSQILSNKLRELIGDSNIYSAMDYGCATGLIGFNLCDKFQKITLMDSEEEMVNIVKEKIKSYQSKNIYPVLIDLTKQSYLEEKFDLIYTSMALHHISDTNHIIETFHQLLNENGLLCVIDLDKEDGSFHMHEKNFKGHNGFEHEPLENIFENIGFSNIKSETFYHGEKIQEGKIIPYSLFYTIGTK